VVRVIEKITWVSQRGDKDWTREYRVSIKTTQRHKTEGGGGTRETGEQKPEAGHMMTRGHVRLLGEPQRQLSRVLRKGRALAGVQKGQRIKRTTDCRWTGETKKGLWNGI